MHIEFEIKILDINIDTIRQTLQNLWAESLWRKEFRRYVYDFSPAESWRWIRLRSDGKETSLTYKHITNGDSIAGVKEAEILVDDFAATHDFLQVIGYIPKAYQENVRESYMLDWCHIEIDTWPHIPSYLEIEWTDEEQVKAMIKTLWLGDHMMTSQNTIRVYNHYGIPDFDKYAYVSFDRFDKNLW